MGGVIKPESMKGKTAETADISKITDYCYLSGCSGLTDELLASLKIALVINCIKGIHHQFSSSIRYVHIPVEDEDDQLITDYFESVISEINKVRSEGGRVLLYCGMGISRSASFLIAYLMKAEHFTLRDAYRFVQSKRQIVCPNVGFFRQLIEYEKSLFDGQQTVEIISPSPAFQCADVVWEEVYQDVTNKWKT